MPKPTPLLLCLPLLLSACWPSDASSTGEQADVQVKRSAWPLVHGVMVAAPDRPEDQWSAEQFKAYAAAAGHTPGWVYLSDNWFRSRAFPSQQVQAIRAQGALPVLRLMLRSDDELYQTEREYTLQRLVDGAFDADLRAWAKVAAQSGGPLLAEYGTEMNGDWFSWNARWNGQEKGAALFKRAYRHLIEVTRAAGADNIHWIFHVNASDWPQTAWNRFEAYFPGTDVIDVLGISAYGAQSPKDDPQELRSLREQLDPALPRLQALAPRVPILLLEFGSARHPKYSNVAWAKAALNDLTTGRWPALRGFAWWNSAWEDAGVSGLIEVRLEVQPELSQVFQAALRSPIITRDSSTLLQRRTP